jgi:hypothetical protein
MRDWNLDPALPDGAFGFEPPDGARSIAFMPLGETGSAGR